MTRCPHCGGWRYAEPIVFGLDRGTAYTCALCASVEEVYQQPRPLPSLREWRGPRPRSFGRVQ